jgi:hypothetical protein
MYLIKGSLYVSAKSLMDIFRVICPKIIQNSLSPKTLSSPSQKKKTTLDLLCEERREGMGPLPSPSLPSSSSSFLGCSSFWSFFLGFLFFLGFYFSSMDGLLRHTCLPPEASPASSGPVRCHRFYGRPPHRCAWMVFF